MVLSIRFLSLLANKSIGVTFIIMQHILSVFGDNIMIINGAKVWNIIHVNSRIATSFMIIAE